MEQSTKTLGDVLPDTTGGAPKAVGSPGVRPRPGGKTDGASEGPSSGTSGATIRRSPLSLGVLLALSVVLLGATLWHLAMVFLTLAPASSVTDHYQKQINGYIYPEFSQNWQMFAPNPIRQNQAIGARVQTTGKDGRRHTWDWVNLSAPHVEAMKHNPLPSHLDQNVLRRAWSFYADNHNRQNRPTGKLGELSTEYLQRLALQNFGRNWYGEKIVAVQLASRVNAVAPPRWTAQRPSDNTDYQVLPWWPVADKDYREL